MPYKKFVEIGRVVFCAEGKEEGKLGIIINVIDQNRILISGPCTDLPRQVSYIF
jgi:large subunit ribosomal protein L14e